MLTSTHHNEEAQLIPVIKNLLREYKKLQLIIAPRHLDRCKEIINLCSINDMSCSLESDQSEKITDIVIINTYGILSKYFFISDIVFLGGSLINLGGHNPVEPANHNCVIMTGSNFFNWQNIYEEMIKNKACLKINSKEDFEEQLRILINNKSKLDILKINSYKFSQSQKVDINYLKNTINDLLEINVC